MTTFQLFFCESPLQFLFRIFMFLLSFVSQKALSRKLYNCKIVPIFKIEERDKPTNYCSISILTFFSKIFEGLLYIRINNFLNKHNVIINS